MGATSIKSDMQSAAADDYGRYYKTNGYAVVPNLIPSELIDQLLVEYKKSIVPSKERFFRQNTARYEKSQLTAHGYVKQSFLDIHDYGRSPRFSDLARQIFFHEDLHQCLSKLTGEDEHNLMQTMLFDANTETSPHQDCWYLDTVPNRNLVAAWIALEDIHEEAGRFYVIPKSFEIDFREKNKNSLSVSEWCSRIRSYYKNNSHLVVAPALKKGDVIFWNSWTVHGALKTQDASKSRKSLTAHFIPASYEFGNLFVTKKFVKYKTHQGKRYFKNQPDCSAYQIIKNEIKLAVYDSPTLLRTLRIVQKLVKNM